MIATPKLFIALTFVAVVLFAQPMIATENNPADDSTSKPLGIKIPKKVTDVYWSIQSEVCTVQVTFCPIPDGEKQPNHPETKVWLLGSSGTTIAYRQKPAKIGISNAGHTTESVIYAFPKSAKTEAVAVVVSINDQIFVKRLASSKE